MHDDPADNPAPNRPESAENAELWFDAKRDHFYLVPDDADLPEGEYVIRSFRGASLEVDVDALADYEISREEASRHASVAIEEVYGKVRSMADKFFGMFRVEDDDVEEEAASPNPMPEHLADLIGVDPGQMYTDTDVARQAVRNVADKVSSVLGTGTAVEDEGESEVDADEDPHTDSAEAEEQPAEADGPAETPEAEPAGEDGDAAEAEEATSSEPESPGDPSANGEEQGDSDEESPWDRVRTRFTEANADPEAIGEDLSRRIRGVLQSPEVTSALEKFGTSLMEIGRKVREASETATEEEGDDS